MAAIVVIGTVTRTQLDLVRFRCLDGYKQTPQLRRLTVEQLFLPFSTRDNPQWYSAVYAWAQANDLSASISNENLDSLFAEYVKRQIGDPTDIYYVVVNADEVSDMATEAIADFVIRFISSVAEVWLFHAGDESWLEQIG